jgi:hypothetical protein
MPHVPPPLPEFYNEQCHPHPWMMDPNHIARGDGKAIPLSENPGGRAFFGLLIALLILDWVFGLLRAYVKIVLLKKVTLDDYFMFTCLVGILGNTLLRL